MVYICAEFHKQWKLLLEFFSVSNIITVTFVELHGNETVPVIKTVQKLNLIVV